jgi:hypothetical protein
MASRATDDQATGRGHTFQIREHGARTKKQQGEPVGSSPVGLFVCIRGLEEGTLSIRVNI